MVKILPFILLALFFGPCGGKKRVPTPPRPPVPAPTVQPTPTPDPSPSATPAASPTPIVMPTPPVGSLQPGPAPTPFPAEQRVELAGGEDLGAAINQVQRPGVREIVISASGRIDTPIVLLPDVRLTLKDGVYLRSHTSGIPIRLKERASVVGPGMNKAGIYESSVKGQWTVVAGFYGTESNGAPDFDITLYGFEVRGAPERDGDRFSTPQAVALGNCKRCRAEDLWINGTHSIGLQVGGGGVHFTPNGPVRQFADSVKVIHCKFTRVASQPLALVNGQDIEFAYNWIEKSGHTGGPGSHPIDLEINQIEDRLLRVWIHHNWIDSREASSFGNGIIVQAGEKIEEIDDIVVEHNVLIGGNLRPATNWMSNGIYVFGTAMKHVTVQFNRVWRTGQACFNVQGAGIRVLDNECVDTGGGGLSGAIVERVTSSKERKSEVARNSAQHLGDGSADQSILVINSPDLVLGENPGFTVMRRQDR